MAIVWVSNGTIANNTSNTLTPSLPASINQGDTLILTIGARTNNVFTTPATWTLVTTQTNSGTAWTSAVYWKSANGSDTNPTIPWNTAANGMAIIDRYTGTDPVWPIGNVSTVATGASTTANSPALTTIRPNSLVVSMVTSSVNAVTVTNATGWNTETSQVGSRTTIESSDQIVATRGTVTAIANNTLSTGGNNTSQQFELIAPVNVPITSATAAAVGPAYEYGLSQAAATASCGSITLSSITSASVVAFVGANNLVGSSLVGWWQFSDGQGTSISDSSGENNTGTLYGPVSWVPGKTNYALNFNGNTNYVSLGNSISGISDGADAFSFAAWINPTNSPLYGGFFSKQVLGGSVRLDFGYIASILYFTTWNQVGNTLINAYVVNAIANGTWAHVAYTTDPNGNSNIYVNGNVVCSNTGHVSNWPNSSFTACIGGDSGNSNNVRNWNGKINDVRLYNTALNASQVLAIYKNYSGQPQISIISQSATCTAVCGSVIQVNTSITSVSATASCGTVIPQANISSSITNATATATSLIALGISEANTSVSVGSVFANIQVTAAITNATPSATSLTTSTATTYTPAQATASATVNPLTNFYVNTGSLAQALATGTVNPLGNLYVNVAAPITNATAFGTSYTTMTAYTPIQANTSAITNPLGNPYINTNPLTQVNVNATTNVIYGFSISQANGFVTASSVFANIQVTLSITNTTSSTTSLLGFGISQANASTLVTSLVPEVNVATVQVSSSTNLGATNSQVYSLLSQVSSTASSGNILYAPSTGTLLDKYGGVWSFGIQVGNDYIVLRDGLQTGIESYGVLLVLDQNGQLWLYNSLNHWYVSFYGAFEASLVPPNITFFPWVEPNVSQASATAEIGLPVPQTNINIVAVKATTGYGSLTLNVQSYPVSAVAHTSAKSLAIYSDQILFINQIFVNANAGIITPQLSVISTEISGTSNLGLLVPKIYVNAASVSSIANTNLFSAFGISQANSKITYNTVVPQINVNATTVSVSTSIGSFIPYTNAVPISVSATPACGSTYENIQKNISSVSSITGCGSPIVNVSVVVSTTNITASSNPFMAFGLSQANSTVSLENVYSNVSVVATTTEAIVSIVPTYLEEVISLTQPLATASVGSTISKIITSSSSVSATTEIGSFYEYGISPAVATLTISPVTTLVGQQISISSAPCIAVTKPLSSFLIDENYTDIISAVAVATCGTTAPQINVVSLSVLATASATIITPQIERSVFEAACIISVSNVTFEIDITNTVSSSTAQAESLIPSLILSPTKVLATSVAKSLGSQINYLGPQVSTNANLGTVLSDIDISVSKTLASTLATLPTSSIFSQAFSASTNAIASGLSPILTISATTSASTPLEEDVVPQIGIVPSQALASVSVKNVSTFSYEHIYVPVAPAICEISINDLVREILPYIDSVTASASVESIDKELLANPENAYATTQINAFPTKTSISVFGISATCDVGTIIPNLRSISREAHCWTVLGVIRLQILSTYTQGVKLRGKADDINLKGRSDEVKLRGKSSEKNRINGYFEKV